MVFLHVAAEVVVFARSDSGVWWAGNLIDSAARWCVPIFVMVSGALLLDPRPGETNGRFLVRRVERLAPPLIFWSALYLWVHAPPGRPFNFDRALESLYRGRPEYHMWYLFMTAGLYAVTPSLRAVRTRASPTQRGVVVAGLFAVAALHAAGVAFRALPAADNVFTMWLPFVPYYLCGAELRRVPPDRVPRAVLGLAALAGVGSVALGTRLLVGRHGASAAGLYFYDYLSPPVILTSIAVFLAVRRAARGAGTRAGWLRVAARIAPVTLGIYLIHPLVLLGLRGLGIAPLAIGGILGVPLVASLAFSLSFLAAAALARVPGLRRVVA